MLAGLRMASRAVLGTAATFSPGLRITR